MSKLKILSIAICCLISALWSETKCAEETPKCTDIVEKTSCVEKVVINESSKSFYEKFITEKPEDISRIRYHRSYSESMNRILNQTTTDVLNGDKKSEDKLRSLFNLKSQTIYKLKGMDERGFAENPILITPEKVLEIFHTNLAIDQFVLQKVDQRKIWGLFVKSMDFPPSKLLEKDEKSYLTLLKSYKDITNDIIKNLNMRLQEDVISFENLCVMATAQKDKLSEFLSKAEKEEEEYFTSKIKYEREIYKIKEPSNVLPSKLFADILTEYGYREKEKPIEEIWITNAAGKNQTQYFQRLCCAVKSQRVFSWNNEEELSLQVKIREKLRLDEDKDNPDKKIIAEEFILSVYQILGRHINKQLIEIISDNFGEVINNLEKGNINTYLF